MTRKGIPDSAIELVAKHIKAIETPQIFEIVPFDQIDNSKIRFYAIDGSYNSEQFYNGSELVNR